MKDLLVRYELNQATLELEKPRQFILSGRMPWLIVSKGFCRLINTIPVSNPFSKPVQTLSVKFDRQVSVEQCCENQTDSCKVSHLCLRNFAFGCE